MKTLFKTVLKLSLVAAILLSPSFNPKASAAAITIDQGTFAMAIRKVVVTGNVNVLILQNENECVKVEDVDMDKVLIKQVGGTLTISSFEELPITIFVYVNDIYRIDASGKANVKTSGRFNVKNLQVLLKDEARARIKATTESLYTAISGRANLELIGTSDNHAYKLTDLAKMDTDKFVALNTENVNTLEGVAVSAANDKTGLSIK